MSQQGRTPNVCDLRPTALHRRAALGLTLLLAGCGSSRLSGMPTGPNAPQHPVRAIALTPAGGILADAVAIELSNRGFTIIEAADASRLLARLNLNEMEVSRPESVMQLRSQGVDAVLSIRAVAGYDQQPQSASARITSTHTGRILAGVTWQNAWGGQLGSMADRQMRRDIPDAAREIAEALAARIQLA